MISREFAEELILLSHKPVSEKPVKQVIFFDGTGGRALAATKGFLELVQTHQTLRKAHDGVNIPIRYHWGAALPQPTRHAIRRSRYGFRTTFSCACW
jgi:hypothetical protein